MSRIWRILSKRAQFPFHFSKNVDYKNSSQQAFQQYQKFAQNLWWIHHVHNFQIQFFNIRNKKKLACVIHTIDITNTIYISYIIEGPFFPYIQRKYILCIYNTKKKKNKKMKNKTTVLHSFQLFIYVFKSWPFLLSLDYAHTVTDRQSKCIYTFVTRKKRGKEEEEYKRHTHTYIHI